MDTSSPLSDIEVQLALAEYPPLREEVNRTIDRMTNNELACAGFVFALILFQLSPAKDAYLPQFVTGPLGALVGITVSVVGENRSQVFRRHLDQVDAYLAALERRFSDRIGWSNHYEKTMRDSDLSRQWGSRKLLWHVVKFSAFLNLILQLAFAFLTW